MKPYHSLIIFLVNKEECINMELQLRNEPLRTETLHSGAWSLRGGQWVLMTIQISPI